MALKFSADSAEMECSAVQTEFGRFVRSWPKMEAQLDSQSPDAKENKQSKPGAHGELNQDHRYLVFTVGKDRFAIPLLSVREVMAAVNVTPVPQAPPHFKGLLNLRGTVIAIMDLRIRLNNSPSPSSKSHSIDKSSKDETSIIILDHPEEPLGVIVDAVDYVATMPASTISPPPRLHAGSTNHFVSGIYSKEEQMILLLNIHKALGIEDLKFLNQQRENLEKTRAAS